MIGSLDLFSDLFSWNTQTMQSKLSLNLGRGRHLFTKIQRNDLKDAMHLVSPFRSELGNEMQEMIVFLKLVYNGPFLKEVSVILKVEQKPLNRSFMSVGNM